MPIKNLSDNVRIPRLGKIHLGIRHPEKGYPIKTDYFVLPKEHPDREALVKAFGEQPRELRVLIPLEDEEAWASQYYRAYNQTFGLVCKGDGDFAMRMIDQKTNGLPSKDTAGPVEMKEIKCTGRECPEYRMKKCHEVMNFRFILPEIPGLGVWQIDTGSINSILNINSCAQVIKKAFGRISLIPLKLTIEPIQVNEPETHKKQTVYVLNLRTSVTMTQLAEAAREQKEKFMLEAPDLESIYEENTQRDIEELWPEGAAKPVAVEQPPAQVEPLKEPEKPCPLRDPVTIKNFGNLYTSCREDFNLETRQDVWKELGVTSQDEIAETPRECYMKIALVRRPPEAK